MHARDGYNYDGYHLRVEFPRGTGPGGRRGGGGGGGRGVGGRGGPPSRRSEYRVLVSGENAWELLNGEGNIRTGQNIWFVTQDSNFGF